MLRTALCTATMVVVMVMMMRAASAAATKILQFRHNQSTKLHETKSITLHTYTK